MWLPTGSSSVNARAIGEVRVDVSHGPGASSSPTRTRAAARAAGLGRAGVAREDELGVEVERQRAASSEAAERRRADADLRALGAHERRHGLGRVAVVGIHVSVAPRASLLWNPVRHSGRTRCLAHGPEDQRRAWGSRCRVVSVPEFTGVARDVEAVEVPRTPATARTTAPAGRRSGVERDARLRALSWRRRVRQLARLRVIQSRPSRCRRSDVWRPTVVLASLPPNS